MTTYATDWYWTEGHGFVDECECLDLANDDLWEDYDETEGVEDLYSSVDDLWRAVCERGVESIRDEVCEKTREESNYAFESTAEMTEDETFEVYGRVYHRLKEASFFF